MSVLNLHVPLYYDGVQPVSIDLLEPQTTYWVPEQVDYLSEVRAVVQESLAWDTSYMYSGVAMLSVGDPVSMNEVQSFTATAASTTSAICIGTSGELLRNFTCGVSASTVSLVQLEVLSREKIAVPVDEWVKTNYFPVGEIYLEPGQVYDCPRHGEEAVEWLYGTNSVFITVPVLADLLRRGLISISEK